MRPWVRIAIASDASAGTPTACPPCDHAQGERLGQRSRPPGDGEALAQLRRQLARARPACRCRSEPLGARDPVRGDADGKGHREQGRDRRTDEHGARHDPAHAQHENRHGRDRDDDRDVHHALHDHRPERRRPTHPLAIAQVVAPDQLP
jgi:hypothetical protein